jgi:hypothetical protein
MVEEEIQICLLQNGKIKKWLGLKKKY